MLLGLGLGVGVDVDVDVVSLGCHHPAKSMPRSPRPPVRCSCKPKVEKDVMQAFSKVVPRATLDREAEDKAEVEAAGRRGEFEQRGVGTGLERS